MRTLESGIVIALVCVGLIAFLDIYLWVAADYLSAVGGVWMLCWLWPNCVSPALDDSKH